MNNRLTNGVTYSPTFTPENGWINWTENSDNISFSGFVTDNAYAGEYTITVAAINQTTNVTLDTFDMKFSILVNDPPSIGNMNPTIIEIPNCLSWDYGSDLVQDAQNDTFTTSLLINGSSSIPNWLTYNLSDYSFSA